MEASVVKVENLVKRYKESRRKHPLSGTGRIDQGITKEMCIRDRNQMRGKITQRELDSIYFSLDMVPMEGEPDQQLRGIIRALETRRKYDGRRLR